MGRVSDGSTREATTGDAGGTAPASPVDEALSLLTRAQDLADQLRADANREVAEARAEASRVRGETQAALDELEQLQATVGSLREEAERRLEETRAEVEIMLADAADQASLLRARATKASDEAVGMAAEQAEARWPTPGRGPTSCSSGPGSSTRAR